VTLAGDPNNPLRFKHDATAEELRAEVMRYIARLSDAGIIDLEALPAPKTGIANQPRRRRLTGINGGNF
jgi:hypothetical protein